MERRQVARTPGCYHSCIGTGNIGTGSDGIGTCTDTYSTGTGTGTGTGTDTKQQQQQLCEGRDTWLLPLLPDCSLPPDPEARGPEEEGERRKQCRRGDGKTSVEKAVQLSGIAGGSTRA